MKTTEQIALKIAHRTCTTYSHNERIKYMFTDQNMIDFAEKFLAAWLEQQSQEPVAYMAPSGTCVTAEDVSYTPNWTDYYTIPLYAAPPPAIPEGARKVFICTSCEGVYADEPTSRCDCMPEVESYDEGYIVMLKAAQFGEDKS